MYRLLAAIFLLAVVLAAATPILSVAEGPALLQDFDRNACYSKCPCASPGVEQLCADCKQKCDDQYWKAFDESFKKKKEN